MGSERIDVVVTWVDGEDPSHQSKLQKYLVECQKPGFHRRALSATRFANSGEIAFCLRSIRSHARWVNRIFLVTDGQIPSWLGAEQRRDLGVTVVDHKEIFRGYEEFLPTFNSLSIETLIHRVPGLSEFFIYLNDDIVFVRNVDPHDYFRAGWPVFRGQWCRLRKTLAQRLHLRKAEHLEGLVGTRNEEKWAPLHGEVFRLAHAPHPLRRSLLEEICDDEAIRHNAQYRFRHKRQFWPMSVLANRALLSGEGLVGPRDWRYVNLEKALGFPDVQRLTREIESCTPVRSVCVQSLDQAPPEYSSAIHGLLERWT